MFDASRQQRLVTAAGFVSGGALFVIRGWPRFTRPGIWAEDGTRFLPGARTGGLASVVRPFDGYLHVIPRVFALVLNLFPLTALPLVYTLTATAVTLLAFGVVLSRRLKWLIPHAWARAAAFVLLCVLPGFTEPYGNLANLIFVCGISSILLGLSADPKSRYGRMAEVAAVFLLSLTGPVLALLLPLYALRLLRTRSRHSIYVLSAAALGSAVQIGVFLTSPRHTRNVGTVRQLGRAIVERWMGEWVLGSKHWRHDWARTSIRELLIGLTLVLLVAAIAELRTAMIPLSLSVLLPLGAAVRVYGRVMYTGGQDRHFVAPHGVLVIAVVATIDQALVNMGRGFRLRRFTSSVPLRGAVVVGVAAVLLAGINGITQDFAVGSIHQPDMAALKRCLDGNAAVCSVRSAPRGWRIRIRQ